MKIKHSTKQAIEKRFAEQFGVQPYAIERNGKEDNYDIFFVQSKFQEMEIAVNRLTGEAVAWRFPKEERNAMDVQKLSGNTLTELSNAMYSINATIDNYSHVSDKMPAALLHEIAKFRATLDKEQSRRWDLTDEGKEDAAERAFNRSHPELNP